MAPEVAVTVIIYVPAGVPLPGTGMTCVGDDVPPTNPLQATKPATATSSSANRNCGTMGCTRRPEVRNKNPAKARAIPTSQSNNITCRFLREKKPGLAAGCDLVAIVNVKVDEAAFGMIVADGENEAVASFGGAVAISVTELE